MKYQTASFTNGMFIVTCPHCGGPVELDEGQLEQINAQLSGRFNCPIATCSQEIEFPNAEEAAALKAGVEAAPAEETPAPTQAAPETPAQAPAAPAPPPQANPAAKPTVPPSATPAPQPEPQPAPAPEPAPAPAPQIEEVSSTPSEPTTAPDTAGSVPEQFGGGENDIVLGFHGSKGASLEREAASVHRLSVKTILHAECVKEKINFDEEVSKFLSSIDEENLVEVHPVQYTDDEKKGNDFGVMILYKIVPEED